MLRDNGHRTRGDRVELKDTIVVEASSTSSEQAMQAQQYEFEVVGIVEDPASAQHFAVCYSDAIDEFIVTDEGGKLLADEALAQDVLTDFLEQAAETPEQS